MVILYYAMIALFLFSQLKEVNLLRERVESDSQMLPYVYLAIPR